MSPGRSTETVRGTGHHFARVAERQTRWLQVPVSFGTWGFKSPLAHNERLGTAAGSVRQNPRNGEIRCGGSSLCGGGLPLSGRGERFSSGARRGSRRCARGLSSGVRARSRPASAGAGVLGRDPRSARRHCAVFHVKRCRVPVSRSASPNPGRGGRGGRRRVGLRHWSSTGAVSRVAPVSQVTTVTPELIGVRVRGDEREALPALWPAQRLFHRWGRYVCMRAVGAG